MKQEFSDYLEKIVGLTELYLERALNAIIFYEHLLPDDIEDIFVSEYIDSGGTRQYENLWIFTSNLVCEAKEFITEEDFDATPIKNRIIYWNLRRTAFNGKTTSNNSRMTVHIKMDTGITGTLKASKENCTKLNEIFDKRFFPNSCNE